MLIEEFRCIWENSIGDLLSKLKNMKRGLERQASQIQRSRKMKKEILTSKLTTLLEYDRSEENLAELLDTKIQLNFEIEKDECYQEKKARINWLKFGEKIPRFSISKQRKERRGILSIKCNSKMAGRRKRSRRWKKS